METEICKALKDFNIGKILKIKKIDTSGNESYIIETNNNKYFLRISPNDTFRGRTTQELLSEVEFVEHLFKNNIPVFPYLKDGKENYIITLNNKNGLIRLFSDGKALQKPGLIEIENFAKLLGKIHKVSENYKTEHDRKHLWDPETTLENLLYDKNILVSKHNGEEFFETLMLSLKKVQELPGLPKGMIHEDLGTRHVLSKNGKIVSVIDFDRCYYGTLVTDLGQAIRGWCFSENSFEKLKYVRFIEAYQTERKLNDNELIYLESAIKFAFLERALSFALNSILSNNKENFYYAQELLKTAIKLKI